MDRCPCAVLSELTCSCAGGAADGACPAYAAGNHHIADASAAVVAADAGTWGAAAAANAAVAAAAAADADGDAWAAAGASAAGQARA